MVRAIVPVVADMLPLLVTLDPRAKTSNRVI